VWINAEGKQETFFLFYNFQSQNSSANGLKHYEAKSQNFCQPVLDLMISSSTSLP